MTAPPTTESTRAAFGKIVGPAADRYNAIVLDTDTGSVRRKPRRSTYVNVGIAEATAVGMAAGIALTGKRSIVVGFSAFLAARAYEFIKLDIALPSRPVVLVGTHGGISGGWLGPTHHSLEDIGLMAGLPNMRVVVPADANRVAPLLAQAMQSEQPVYMRLGRKPSSLMPTGTLVSDRGWTLLHDGQDGCFVAVGPECLHRCLAARELLLSQGDQWVGVAVLEDYAAIPDLAARLPGAGPLIVAEEAWAPGPVASRLRNLTGRPVVDGCTLFDRFMPPGSHEELLDAAGLTPDGLRAMACTRSTPISLIPEPSHHQPINTGETP